MFPLRVAGRRANHYEWNTHDFRQDLPGRQPPPKFASIGSPYFGIMLAVMAVVLILSNIGASKGVAIGPVITDGGFFLFPLAYILGDVISEVYGFKVARKAIITSFALSVFASLCYWVIIALPGFDDDYGAAKQAALEGALGPVPQIVLASLLAFLAGQTINSWILVKMKARTGERSLWARIMGSSVAGEFVDTLIFCSIAASVIGITDAGDVRELRRSWASSTRPSWSSPSSR